LTFRTELWVVSRRQANSVRLSPPLFLCYSLGHCPLVFANLSAHSSQWRRQRARKK
jgi:hypothetical protein